MDEKFKTYNYNTARIIIHLVALPPILFLLAKAVISPVTEKNHDMVSLSVQITMLMAAMTFVLYLPYLLKGRFTADEFGVSFRLPLSREVSIRYIDIVGINVHAEKKLIWSPGSRSCRAGLRLCRPQCP